MKRLFLLLLAISMLFCFIACSKEDAPDTDNTSANTQQSEISATTGIETADKTSPAPSIKVEETTNAPENTEHQTAEPSSPVFDTENITRIAFTTNYGYDDECEVPEQYITEITTWLGTFTIDEIVPEDVPIPPGTGFYFVKIEYSDGTIVENSLSTIEIDGISYYMSSAETPECFMEILSQNN